MPNADSEFFTSFNAALEDMEANFGEEWKLYRTGITYQAISMDRDTVTSQVMSGGKFVDSQSMLFVREDVCVASGVKKGDIIIARGERFSVKEIDHDGDASRTLLLGPASINSWK